MSTSGEGDNINPSKDGITSSTTIPEGMPCSSLKNQTESCSLRGADQNTPLTSTKVDNSLFDDLEENSEELEAVIEKKLTIDKEKALDVDSELDFELKWDDDTDQNEDQTDSDIYLDNELKETDSIQPTVKNDVTKVAESQGTLPTTSNDKFLSLSEFDAKSETSNTIVDEVKTSKDAGEETEIKSVNKTNNKELDNLDIELNRAEDELLKSDDLDDQYELNYNDSVDDLLKADRHDNIDNVSANVQNDLLNSDMAIENEIDLNVDTNAKSAAKISPNESETNSLDEHLVYSDVDAPDIEDKDLMDEIEAQITDSEKNIDTVEDIQKPQDKEQIPNKKESEPTDIAMIEKGLETVDQMTKSDKNIDMSEDIEKPQDIPEIITNQKESKAPETTIIEKEIEKDLETLEQLIKLDKNIDASENIEKPQDIPEIVTIQTKESEVPEVAMIEKGLGTVEQMTKSDENIDMSEDIEKPQDIPEIITCEKESKAPEITIIEKEIEKDLGTLEQTAKLDNNINESEDIEELQDITDISSNQKESETPEIEPILEKGLESIEEATKSENEKLGNNENHEALSEIIISQKEKESSATSTINEKEMFEKDIVSKMDVDDDVTKSNQTIEKSDPSDTLSSTDMDSSSYDINKEHGLDRPDVMIEIPTQELIEAFDDSDDTSDITEEIAKLESQIDNDTISKPDVIENIDSKAQSLDLIESQKIVAKTFDTDDNVNNTVKNLVSAMIADNAVGGTAQITQIEGMDVDNNAVSEVTEKPGKQNMSIDNSNVETIKPDDIESKMSHADITLENSEQPKPLSADDLSSTSDSEVNKDIVKVETLEKPKTETIEDVPKPKQFEESEPSTSKYHQELSDEDQETTDTLGLLAESSRVLEDDDEQEQEEQPEDDDEDDDFDQDDESNLMTAEHSEDSNPQQSETDVPKDSMDVDESNEPETNNLAEQDMDSGDVDEAFDANLNEDLASDNADESSADKDFGFQIGEVVSEKADVVAEKIYDTEKAVEAILEELKTEESTDAPTATILAETVKQSDAAVDGVASEGMLRKLLLKDSEPPTQTPEEKKSPSKKKLEISKPKHEINIVELEESSSEDDIQVVSKQAEPAPKDVTSVKIPEEVEVMSAADGDPSAMTQEPGETVISGLPKPQAHKPARLNTDEVTIKTATPTAEPLVIPETKAPKTPEAKTPIDLGSEIFSLDSDDEIQTRSKRRKKLTAVEMDKARETNKCINTNCTSDASVQLVSPSVAAAVYYAANLQRGGGMCVNCAKRFEERSEKLIQDVKDLTPYLDMDMCMIQEEFVEISDSDSDDEVDLVKKDDEIIGEKNAKFLEEHLADMFNDTWKKYNMEARLLTAETEINVEVEQLEEECKKIDAMLEECQKETDRFRNHLYEAFADERKELPPITLYDTPTSQWCGLEDTVVFPEAKENRQPKRRPPPAAEPPAKRAAIPLGYTPLDLNQPNKDASKPAVAPPEPATKPTPLPAPAPASAPASVPAPAPGPAPAIDMTVQNEDDNADISVVRLSVEAAPAGLPPPGVATRPPLRPHMQVYAMRNSFGAWHRVTIVEVQPKVPGQFTTCRVRFEQPKNTLKVLPARCLAYEHPPDVRLTIGTRVVALFKDHRYIADTKMEAEKKEAYYSGIVAEIPNPVNNFRYLIFFDDGYAQYVQHSVTRLVCECAPRVWDEVHPLSRQFVREYLRAYPERPMVRLHAGQSIKTECNGRWWVSKVLAVDASLVHVHFEGKKEGGIPKTEWIYRGSTRLAPLYLELQAAERQRSRPLPRAQAGRRFNMPYVEYTRSEQEKASPPPISMDHSRAQIEQEIRRQRAVAKKSTAQPPQPPPTRDNVTSRVVFYTPKNAIKPYKMVPHTCGPKCKRTDVLALKDLRTYNPLTKPLLSGWERHQVRYRIPAVKAIIYRAPCGRRIRDYDELHRYLQVIDSDMGVDLFDFNPSTHCLAEFLLNKCLVSKKDLSHGKENVPVPCVNYYDESLPEFCSYNTERTPTAGVPLNLDPEFLCGCDCTDDCADKTKCACWKMTLEGARTIGLDTDEVGYVYKRLPEPLPSGIYECNVRCKCKQTCLNRVAQHPLQLKLQVFKTANRGWGIRALNDVPKGAFLCVYAGNLLTDATANLDGLNEGDEYLAELDYIEVVEQMKEGFEEDIPEDAKKLDQEESESSSMSSSSDEEPANEHADDDFKPLVAPGDYAPSEYSKRLRKREKLKKGKEKDEKEKKEKGGNTEDCITISDDEELREPVRFAARAGMGGKEFISKYKSVRAHFGRDEACYIMDAKVQGNIGRYLNHSCTPNVFVQNVFVDTHDPRFPWVAFFALSQIRAGTELTWNYNYDVGSVPGKVLYCYCNAPNCRGRLL